MVELGDSAWRRRGATLSDKTARRQHGLPQHELVEAIRAGQLQYRQGSAHGNHFLRLLRQEVELLVKRKHGADHLQAQQAVTELASVERELKGLRKQIAALQARRARLLADLQPASAAGEDPGEVST